MLLRGGVVGEVLEFPWVGLEVEQLRGPSALDVILDQLPARLADRALELAVGPNDEVADLLFRGRERSAGGFLPSTALGHGQAGQVRTRSGNRS